MLGGERGCQFVTRELNIRDSVGGDLRAEETHDFVLDYQDGPLVVGRCLFLLPGSVAATLIK